MAFDPSVELSSLSKKLDEIKHVIDSAIAGGDSFTIHNINFTSKTFAKVMKLVSAAPAHIYGTFVNCSIRDIVYDGGTIGLCGVDFRDCDLKFSRFEVKNSKNFSRFEGCDMVEFYLTDYSTQHHLFVNCEMHDAVLNIQITRASKFRDIVGEVNIYSGRIMPGNPHVRITDSQPWVMYFTATHMRAGCQWHSIDDWKSFNAEALRNISAGASELSQKARLSAITIQEAFPPESIGPKGFLYIKN